MTSPVLTLAIVTKDQPAALKLCIQSALENAKALKGRIAVRVTLNGSDSSVVKAVSKYVSRLEAAGVAVLTAKTAPQDVYLAYNVLVACAPTELVCLANDDMVFGPDWATPLVSVASRDCWPSPVLVEPGVVGVAQVNVQGDFGRDPDTFDREGFFRFARRYRGAEIVDFGWFMPVVVHKQKFLEIGGYPLGKPFPSPQDLALFRSLGQHKVKHVRHYGSWAYHFQRLSQRGDNEPQSGVGDSAPQHAGHLGPVPG